MILDKSLILEFEEALARYKQDVAKYEVGSDEQEHGDMITNTLNRLLHAVKAAETESTMLELLTFSRQASDTFCQDPPSMMALCEAIRKIRNTEKGKGVTHQKRGQSA